MLGALLSFAHHAAIIAVALFLAAEFVLLRPDMGAGTLERIARADLGYFLCAGLAVVTGGLLLGLSERGFGFYAANLLLWTKITVFFAVAALSMAPSSRYSRWRRMAHMDGTFKASAADAQGTRRLVAVELSGLLVILLLAAFVRRGIGN